MIVVKLWGGLGNQLFQYAFGYCLSKAKEDVVLFDINFYERQPSHVGKREVKIDKYFNLTRFDVISRPKEVSIFENRLINKGIRVFPKFYVPWFNNLYFVKEKPGRFISNVPYKKGKNNYYDGYWQSSLYFNQYCEDLQNEFIPNSSIENELVPFLDQIDNRNSVAVHVRRGDLLNKRNLPSCFTEETLVKYYDEAISYIESTAGKQQLVFISDDIQWCRKRWSNLSRALFIDNKTQNADVLDLLIISKCKHGIMSPSTFSWWGNWLRKEKTGSIVVVPNGEYSNPFFLEESWIKISL